MIKLYREMKDWDVYMEVAPIPGSDSMNFMFSKDGLDYPAHIADFETMRKEPELVEMILISEMHDFLHRYFGVE